MDGYNIINAWDNLKDLLEVSLESARIALLDILSNYQGYKGMTVIVVFDGYLVKGNRGTVRKYKNIYEIYTKEAETADHYIEKTVNKMPKEYNVRVASSDGLVQLIILGRGAVRMSARELKNEIESTEKTIREKFIDNKPAKNNLLTDNLDEEMRIWIENLRRGG